MHILIVDDHPLTCQGLAALLQATQRDARASSVYSAAQAREALQRLPAPDWIFLDINLPDDPQHLNSSHSWHPHVGNDHVIFALCILRHRISR